MIEEKIDVLLRPLIKKGIKLIPKADYSKQPACCESKFGGLPYAEKGCFWPSCPTCNKELTFIIQILNKNDDMLFVFYYCNECFPWGLDGEEKGQWVVKNYEYPSLEKLTEISRKTNDEFAPIPCKINEASVLVLPDWEGIDSASEEVGSLCCKINDDSPWEAYEESVIRASCLNDYTTLLGGYPRYVQVEASARCSECKSQMDFFAQIDSEDEAGLIWGDVGLVYFYYCPIHKDEFHLELQSH